MSHFSCSTFQLFNISKLNIQSLFYKECWQVASWHNWTCWIVGSWNVEHVERWTNNHVEMYYNSLFNMSTFQHAQHFNFQHFNNFSMSTFNMSTCLTFQPWRFQIFSAFPWLVSTSVLLCLTNIANEITQIRTWPQRQTQKRRYFDILGGFWPQD